MVTIALTILLLPLLAFVLIVFVTRRNQMLSERRVLGTTDPFTTFVATLSFWVGAVASIAAAYMMVARIANLIRAALALTTVLGAVAMMYALLGR